MQPLNPPPEWPVVLLESHWKKALGLKWRWNTQSTGLGFEMKWTYGEFRHIQWAKNAAQNAREASECADRRFLNTLAGLTKIYLLAEQAVDDYKRKAKNYPPENNFFTAAHNVAKEAKKLAEILRERVPGRYTPRSQPGPHSLARSAEGRSSSSNGTADHPAKPLKRRDDLVERYRACSEWPELLTRDYGFQRMNSSSQKKGEHFDRNWPFAVFLRHSHAVHSRIKWTIYKNLLRAEDKVELQRFYNDYIVDLYDIIVELRKAVAAGPGDLFQEDEPIQHRYSAFFKELTEEATKQEHFYYSLPGSIFTSEWQNEF